MAICLDYQSVYTQRPSIVISVRLQVIASILLLAALSAKVWIKLESTDVGYQLARAQAETVNLDMQRREFELETSLLKRPDNLARAARKLGLSELNPNQARRLRMSGE